MKAVIFLSVFMIAMNAWADLTIFDVRKNLPMSDDEKVLRDFYINAGSEAGLATGMVITVQRRMPLYDSYQNRTGGQTRSPQKTSESHSFGRRIGYWIFIVIVDFSFDRNGAYFRFCFNFQMSW